jgi:hypothetical protein
MADGRRNNGGHSTKGFAGRKPKNEEHKLIEKLTPLAPKAFNALNNALEGEESWAVKLFFEYYFGKPNQRVDHTTNGESLNKVDVTKEQIDKLIDKL